MAEMTARKLHLLTWTVLTGLALGSALAAPSYAGTYRWVDKQGHVHYSDHIPPEAVDRAYSVINQQGITVKNIDEAKTPEQLAEERRIQAQREEEQRQTRERVLQDRILLDTYSTVDDLIETRDRHLATLEGLIDVSQHKLTNLRAELDKLTRTAANLERGGKTVSGELRDDISNLQGQIERENSFIRSQRAQQNEVREKFAADVARYKQLRALQAKQ